jgi:F0F1-type ATP synthase membrane subunit b/b'
MNIIPNLYLLSIQLIPFLVSVVALYLIIFKPMLAYLSERSSMTDGAKAEAEALLEKVQAQVEEHETRLTEANAEVRTIRADRRHVAMQAYAAKIDVARKAADGHISAALVELGADQVEAREQLRGQVDALADQIAGNILQNLAS